MVTAAELAPYYGNILHDATIPELPNHYRGKVRDNYDLSGGRRIIIASDRLSAFDKILTAIPLKGQVLTEIARFWFDATSDICANHVVEYPDPNVLVCTTSTSILSMYKAGRRAMYGMVFPDGMRANEKLPQTIITPTTKAFDGAHDEELTAEKIVAGGLLGAAQWREVCALALALFARGREIAERHGLILVDT